MIPSSNNESMSAIIDENQIKKTIKNEFTSYLGRFIKRKRTQKNITQDQLSNYLGIDRSSLSKYESGQRDMGASLLPLISHYCQFQLFDYFSLQNAEEFYETFNELIRISKKMTEAKPKLSEDILIGRIYQSGDKEIIKKIPSSKKLLKIMEEWQRPKNQSKLDVSMVFPFSAEEMKTYLMRDENEDKRRLLGAARIILDYSKKQSANTMEKKLAEFVIENCLKESDIELQKRLVAYYRAYYNDLL